MKLIKILTPIFSLLIISFNAYSQPQLDLKEFDGGSVITNLVSGIQVNKDSTLKRKWFVINDNTCPIQLNNSGINTGFKNSELSYYYWVSGRFEAKTAISAYEVRFILFDVWNEYLTTLAGTNIKDLTTFDKYLLGDSWSWFASENDVSELYTVVSFVAHVRTPDGSVWIYNNDGIAEQIKSIKIQFDKEYLSLPKPKDKK
jgi:hypothetical protein